MDKIRENFRLTINYINKFSHKPVPEIYTVWYNYVTGENLALREEIDALINSGKTISFDAISNIYKRYFVSYNEENVNKIIYDVNNLIVELLGHVSENSKFYDEGANKLRYIGEKLKKSNDKDGIKEILSTLVNDIKKIRDKEKSFTSTLKQSEQEFTNLHNELEKLKQEARIDILTGILNRRGFDAEMENILDSGEIDSIAVIFADIDNFKKFNDTYGHLVGDEVLKYTAKIFKNNLKGKDILARFGGEEFIVVILNTDFKNVISIAENLRKMVSEKSLIIKRTKQKLPRITISLGVAQRKENESVDKLIERADKLMYHSKQNGKNRVSY